MKVTSPRGLAMQEVDQGSVSASRSLAPVIELLQDELEALGIELPSGTETLSISDFSQWYLEATDSLERHVAESEEHPPMLRKEIELMCRCTLTCSTLGEAMKMLKDFCAMLYPRAGSLHLELTGENVRFTLNSLRRQQTSASSLVDITGLFAFKQLIQWLSGGRVLPKQVGIGTIRREDVLPFLRLFNTPVLTGGNVYYLEYSNVDLTSSVVATAGDFEGFFEFFPCSIFHSVNTGLEQQISALISAAVRQALPIPNLSDIARTLEVAPSTFRRRLAQQGRSFREIRDQYLYEAAVESLMETDTSVGDLAVRLGFRNTSTFRRAFQRWAGVSPSDWRVAHMPDGGY